MDKICEKPIQVSNRYVEAYGCPQRLPLLRTVWARPPTEPEAVPLVELARALGVPAPVIASSRQSTNQIRAPE